MGKRFFRMLPFCFLTGAISFLMGCAGTTLTDVTIVKSVNIREDAKAGVTFCEGSYECTTGGKVFSTGDKTKVGFYSVTTCPLNTTLGDGSSWQHKGTCDCS